MMGEGEFTVIDLDAPKNATPEQYEDFEKRATDIIQMFNSYTERSNSGKGYHIFIRATKALGSRCKESALGYEVYNHSRYLIVTGEHLPHTPCEIMPRQAELEQFIESVFPREVTQKRSFSVSTGGEIGTIEKVLDIWEFAKNGQAALMAYHEPSQSSEDDMRLISHLAFYLPDEEVLYDAFRSSPAFREDQIARRGGEERYKRWCISQNIRRAINNLESRFDWSEDEKETDEMKRLAEQIKKRYSQSNG